MYKKNTSAKFSFKAVDLDGNGVTGLTITAKTGKDGAALAAASNSVVESGIGWYYITLTSTEMNGDLIVLDPSASGVTIAPITISTESDYTADRATNIDSILAYATRTVGRGTAASGASTTGFTAATMSPAGASVDQFKRRVILFDSNTTTAALRGVVSVIQSSTNAALPAFTLDPALPTAPAAGDSFNVL